MCTEEMHFKFVLKIVSFKKKKKQGIALSAEVIAKLPPRSILYARCTFFSEVSFFLFMHKAEN